MKVLKGLAAIGISLAIVAAGAYIAARAQLTALDDAARAKAPGQFARLSDGQVHYSWHDASRDSGHARDANARDGRTKVVVLVHGFSTPSYVWAGLLEPFAAAGFRVLSYDNYGRGFSDRPKVANDAALFDRQLLELLDSQGIDQPIDLVGYSMGGAIATYFAANHPAKVRRLGLIAPAGFPVNTGSTELLLNVPVLGDWFMAVFGKRVLLDVMSAPENQGRAIPDIAARYEVQMRYEGYLRSLLSTMRDFPMGDMEAEYRRVGESKIPLLAIWGDRDRVVPPQNAARIEAAVPHAQFERIAGGTHAITYSEPELVSQALIRFFEASGLHNATAP